MKHILTLGFSLLLVLPLHLGAQTFKVTYEFPEQHPGVHLQARRVVVVPGTQEFAIVGDLKGNAPDYKNSGFLIRTDRNGDPKVQRAITTNSATSLNGIRAASVAVDSEGNYYVGGAFVQHYAGLGRGSEKTLTSIAPGGAFNWASMASNWSFEALHFNQQQQQIYTFSGPDNGNYPAVTMVSRFASDGRLIDGTYLPTDSETKAVAMAYHEEVGEYYLVGIASADLQPSIMVANLDSSMNLHWSSVYESPDVAYETRATAWHPDGYLLVAGLATHHDGTRNGFLLALTPGGSELFLRHYHINGHEEFEINGVAAVSSLRTPSQNGAILVGTTRRGATDLETHSVAIAVDGLGDIRWTQGYSNYQGSDLIFAEGFSDVTALSATDEFIATGQYHVYFDANTVVDRRVVLVRAPISNGILSDNGQCLRPLEAQYTTASINQASKGNSYTGGTAQGFLYQVKNLPMNVSWCTLEYTGSQTPPPPPAPGSRRRVYPFAGQLDPNILGPIQIVGSSLQISILSNQADRPPLTYAVYDLQGRQVAEGNIDPQQSWITVHTQGWANSLYLLHVKHLGQPVTSRKLLIPGPFAQ